MAKFDGVPVKVGRAIYDKIKDYALLHNKNIQQAVNEGLEIWLDCWAEPLTEGKLERMAVSFSHAEEPRFVSLDTPHPAKHPS